MNKIIKEPLLIFLILGGAIFFIFQQTSDDVVPDKAEIVVTQGHIQALSLRFEKVWKRSPSDKELDGLIQNHVREEVLYREALAMDLDREDAIIKRRLRQKIEFISEDLAGLEAPEEQELQSYLEEHRQDYRKPARFSFRQIYFDVSKRGQNSKSDAMKLLKTLQTQDHDITSLGDRLMVKQRFDSETGREIERALGAEFLQSLRKMPTGSWQGPINSGFGLHLVHIAQRIDGKYLELDEARELVVRDWTFAKRKKYNEVFYEALRKRYKVTVEKPKNGKLSKLSMSGATN